MRQPEKSDICDIRFFIGQAESDSLPHLTLDAHVKCRSSPQGDLAPLTSRDRQEKSSYSTDKKQTS
jgi:hypothetical protein